jgi:hypothetical protein
MIEGMSIRDYLAAHCPESELPQQVTEGDIMKAYQMTDLNGQRLDPEFRKKATTMIRAWARYDYADMMIEAGLRDVDWEKEDTTKE